MKPLIDQLLMGIEGNKASQEPGLGWTLVNMSCQPPKLSRGSGPIVNNGSVCMPASYRNHSPAEWKAIPCFLVAT